MREQLKALLSALGVTDAADDPLLTLALEAAEQRIRNLTNQSETPRGLEPLAVRLAAAEFLRMRRTCGRLEGFDLELAVKQLQEGDTNTTFAVGEGSATPEQRLTEFITALSSGCEAELYRYRRIAW